MNKEVDGYLAGESALVKVGCVHLPGGESGHTVGSDSGVQQMQEEVGGWAGWLSVWMPTSEPGSYWFSELLQLLPTVFTTLHCERKYGRKRDGTCFRISVAQRKPHFEGRSDTKCKHHSTRWDKKAQTCFYLQYIHMCLHAVSHSLFEIVAFLLKLNYTQGNCQLGPQDKKFASKGHYVVLEKKFKLRIFIFMISLR